jgi:hypothetical protein
MPLHKIVLKPGVNRENTRYTSEGGYYESDKVRFRQGTPEKIGGWARISAFTFLGTCRSLWNWVTLSYLNLLGVGTNLKFYIESGGRYRDITPIRAEVTLTNPFATVNLSTTVTVTDAAGGYSDGDFVTFYGSTAVGGITILGEYQITFLTGTTYAITSSTAATSTATGGGTVYAVYQVNVGAAYSIPTVGWGSGAWSSGAWGFGTSSLLNMRIWNQDNFGQDLLFGPRDGPLYLWNATIGVIPSAVTMTIASPCVVSFGLNLTDKTAITLETDGALPTGLLVGTVYYVRYLTSTTFNLSTSTTLSATLSGVTITGVAGQFSCAASSVGLAIGQSLVLSGTYGGTGSITGYTNPTTYFIVATNGSTTFTLSTTAGGSGVTTTAGTPTGITYTLSTIINTSGTQSGTHKISPRGIALTALNGASSVPLTQASFIISDASRFTILFGTNDYGSTEFDPMLIRWSDQESYLEWAPAITNQAGSIRLSHGSKIITALQSRQEIVVLTDSTMYSLQYLGPPYVWGTQLLADNISIAGPNSIALGSGIVFWMGVDKFYKYDGRVQTLRCDLRQYIFNDINLHQADQIFASTSEGFNEVWFFYCSASSTSVDRYVIYNYVEDIWMYGNMARTAWLDSGLREYPVAATYSNNIVNHEFGVDDNVSGTPAAIEASITSSQFDIGDGHNMAFVWRMLPDLTFRGSTSGTTPSLTMQLLPLQNSGSGYNDPKSVGGTSSTAEQTVTATQTYPIDLDTFTGQVNIRVRGRQMSMKIASNTLGTQWQLGSPRIDFRPDGRR